jgi:zinc transporter ZupT
MIYLAICYGLLLGVIHFFSESIQVSKSRARWRLISFAAGLSIAYLFLDLLPHTYHTAVDLREWVFLFLLLGFTVFHLIEKYIYQHTESDRRMKDLKEVHSIAFFVYHFSVGIALEEILRASVLEGSLFVVPVAFHAGLSSASLSGIHGDLRERMWVRVLLSLSTLAGVLFATLIHVPAILYSILVSLIAGVLLYIIVREFLPHEEKGKPLYFVLGLIFFLGLHLITSGTGW